MEMQELVVFIGSALLSYLVYGPIRAMYSTLKIVDTPDWRKVNFRPVALGAGLVLMLVVFNAVAGLYVFEYDQLNFFSGLAIGMITLYIVGLVDDVYQLRASVKFIIHVFMALMTTLSLDVVIFDLHGLFGLDVLPNGLAVFLSFFVILVFINIFNLVDGIDGLAIGISLIALIIVYPTSVIAQNQSLSTFLIAVSGCIVVLFSLNHSKTKMYLGDSGSTALGYLLSCVVLYQLTNAKFTFPLVDYTLYGPVYCMCIFWYPLVDVTRVILIRLKQGKSIFSPDRNHLHHILVDSGLSHLRVSILLMLITFVFSLLSFYLSKFLSLNILFAVMFLLALILTKALIVYSRTHIEEKLK